ncbi:MAG: M67 family metallopeptidase [Candidatus Thorarchaeota archaeon]|nr:MAG: M67 family metallopeptidase [Candidatus Thorarchaeota archaeon]
MRLSKAALEQLHTHAEKALPLESVALLFGHIQKSEVIVARIEFLENVAASTTSFAVDPEREYHLLMDAEERGEEMVGIFHSHPAPPIPSPRDLRNMRLNPVVWAIASKSTGSWETRAFLLEDENLIHVQIDLT